MHHGPWSLAGLLRRCDEYGRLGVPLHFSEVTVLSGERLDGNGWGKSRYEYEVMQGEYVPKLYAVLFGHPAVEGIIMWVFWAGNSWRGSNAGLANRDWTLKEAGKRYEALMDEWTTEISAMTDTDGLLKFRGFHGDYEAKATGANGIESDATFSIEKSKGPQKVKIQINFKQ